MHQREVVATTPLLIPVNNSDINNFSVRKTATSFYIPTKKDMNLKGTKTTTAKVDDDVPFEVYNDHLVNQQSSMNRSATQSTFKSQINFMDKKPLKQLTAKQIVENSIKFLPQQQ